MQLAWEVNAVIVISGQTDYITDGELVEMIYNGSTMMEKVTGMGCTATAVLGAFAAVNPSMLDAAIHGMAVMGIAGLEFVSGDRPFACFEQVS
jgi:hydroxyethylthiazole kinase